MTITFQPFTSVGRARITQLINKSNQYNLTTKRYTEAQIADLEADENFLTLQVRLSDIYGDNGMISVIICERKGDALDINTWLMSCRVLGRKVEHAVLQEIMGYARDQGIQVITGIYKPTERNQLVEDHYAKLGFELADKQQDGTTAWRLDMASAPVEEVCMTIVRLDQ